MSIKLDSKKKSASEAFVNSFGGYPIGYGVGIIVLPLSMGWIQEDPLVANLAITLVYAVVSFVRSYFLRRTFEKYGIDDNFLKLGIKFFKKCNKFINFRHPLFRFYRIEGSAFKFTFKFWIDFRKIIFKILT